MDGWLGFNGILSTHSMKLSTTFTNVSTSAFWPMVDILCILRELGSRA